MHCKITDAVVKEYHAHVWSTRLSALASVAASAAVIALVSSALTTYSSPSSSSSASSSYWEGVLPYASVSSFFTRMLSLFSATKSIAVAPVNAVSAVASSVNTTVTVSSSTTSTPTATTAVSATVLAKRIMLGTISLCTLGTSLFCWWQSRVLDAAAKELGSAPFFLMTFKRLYSRQLAEGNAFTSSLWERVRERLPFSLTFVELKTMHRVKASDLAMLDRIIDDDLANLRRRASPVFPVLLPISPFPVAVGGGDPSSASDSSTMLAASTSSEVHNDEALGDIRATLFTAEESVGVGCLPRERVIIPSENI